MKKILALLLTIAAFCHLAADPNAFTARESVPFTVRGGLPNFAAKLKAGKDVTIVYFGGSITEQNGWRVQSTQFLQKDFPKSKITPVNAAIGGTGSDLGVFRLNSDALRHKPDLLFVEFAVNDAGAPPLRIRKAMEGIVRQTLTALPECDICFVYTLTKDNLKDYQAGKLPRSASVMEDIADHYKIPTVNISYEAAQMEKDGKLVIAGSNKGVTRVSGDELNELAKVPRTDDGKIIFSGDGVHPHADTGHVLYTKALKEAFPALLTAGKAGKHEAGEPLLAGNWDNTAAVSLDAPEITLSGKTTLLEDAIAKQFARRQPKLWRLEPGASIEFKFKGSKAMLYDLYGPDTGILEITVDGKSREVRRFDGYCTYRRLALCGLADNLDPSKVHTVKITVADKKFDKRAILFERNRGDFDKNPAKYADFVSYAGTLFLVGELLP